MPEFQWIAETKKGVRLRVKVNAGARESRLLGIRGNLLQISVTAAPEKGKANTAVCSLIAKVLGIPGNRVVIRGGTATPLKTLEITGIPASEVEERLRRALNEHDGQGG